jgi:hypothetical protein
VEGCELGDERMNQAYLAAAARGFGVAVDGVIDDEHLDSFWYDGLVLLLNKGGYEFKVYAVGDIRIFHEGELVYDVKERNKGFPFPIKTDEDLDGPRWVEEDLVWENNNWFELIVSLRDAIVYEGLVFHRLDELPRILDDVENEKDTW